VIQLATAVVRTIEPVLDAAVRFEHVSFGFEDHVVLRDVSFSMPRGSMTILLGASGSGKSVMLKLMLGLLRSDSGSVIIQGQAIETLSEPELMRVRGDIGMLFQEGALFDSLTVAENVGYRLSEELRLPASEVRARVEEVLGFIGLTDCIDRKPSELSGGQRRRVAIARAIAAKPSLLLFDDPTTGLDPIIAATVDDEIVKLRDLEHVTSIVVTHQIRDAVYIARHQAAGTISRPDIRVAARPAARFLVLHEGRIYFEGTIDALLASPDAYLREFLNMTLPPW
jgi:phospholipid/cholesterol/gamma-HCH transport system ATP-binding protein